MGKKMTDTKKLPREEFFKIIDEKCNETLGAVKCTSCGGNEWTAYNDGESMLELSIPFTSNLMQGIPSYAISCLNCGEFRFFAAKAFHKQ